MFNRSTNPLIQTSHVLTMAAHRVDHFVSKDGDILEIQNGFQVWSTYNSHYYWLNSIKKQTWTLNSLLSNNCRFITVRFNVCPRKLPFHLVGLFASKGRENLSYDNKDQSQSSKYVSSILIERKASRPSQPFKNGGSWKKYWKFYAFMSSCQRHAYYM